MTVSIQTTSPATAEETATLTRNNTAMAVKTMKPKNTRLRAAPNPNSVLDRAVLLRLLEEQDLEIKPMHIDSFYQNMHRQQYPDLPEFLEQYKKWEGIYCGKTSSSMTHPNSNDNNNNHENHLDVVKQPQQSHDPLSLPLKNAVSGKKNRNKQQLPKPFLDFLEKAHNEQLLTTLTSKIVCAKTSKDGSTTKLVIELHDGQRVESVLMRYQPSVRTVSKLNWKNEKENGDNKKENDNNNNDNGTSTTVIKGGNRVSLCVSSQCGCAMGCTFCATGTMGLSGNLTTAEILEQIVHADRLLAQEYREHNNQQQQQQQNDTSINNNNNNNNDGNINNNNATTLAKKFESPKLHLVRNVVFMGMGEPLDNYNNVLQACRSLIDRKRWNLAHGRVTVSTVGIISKIKQLTRDLPQISLALSLHAPTQEKRQAIVPTAKHFPVQDLIEALDQHMMAYLYKEKDEAWLSFVDIRKKKRQQQQQQSGVFSPQSSSEDDDSSSSHSKSKKSSKQTFTKEERIKESTRRRAMIEYVMLEGPTSSIEAAHELGKLCQDRQLIINLIPYNPTNVKDPCQCPSLERMEEFKNIVQSYGSFCTIRRTMGQDIDSACGQLVTKQEQEEYEQQQKQKQQLAQQQQQTDAAAAEEEIDIEDIIPNPSSKSQLLKKGFVRAKKPSKSNITFSSTTEPSSSSSSNAGNVPPASTSSSSSLVSATNNSDTMKQDRDLDEIRSPTPPPPAPLEKWIVPLTIATSIAATCFLASAIVFFGSNRRRR